MTAAKQLKASVRDKVGKGAARAIRRQGQIPAVIYGAGEAATTISLSAKEAKQLIFAGHFLTTVFEIEYGAEKERVIPRDYQLDPVKDAPLHIDFLRVGRDATVDVDVPVHFINHEASPGLKEGGTLNVVSHAIGLTVGVDAIPEAIIIDLTGLNIGDSVHVKDVVLPAGATPAVAADAEATIATIAPPTVAAEPAGEEGEAPKA